VRDCSTLAALVVMNDVEDNRPAGNPPQHRTHHLTGGEPWSLDFYIGLVVVAGFGLLAIHSTGDTNRAAIATAALGVMGTVVGHHMGFRHGSSSQRKADKHTTE
jgi:hypothetical protein